MELTQSSTLITGGASGLGAACARALAIAGSQVVIADIDHERGRTLAHELGGAFTHTDVRDADDVQRAVDMASVRAPLRIVLNCAGIGSATRTVDRSGTPHALDEFQRVININLVGTFNVLRIAAAVMSTLEPIDEDGLRGVIINTASVAAFDGQIGQAAYSASKGGIVGMTLPIARDLAAIGVRVNTIAPGLIDTPIYGEGELSDAFKANLGANVLFPKRLGSSDEFASLVLEIVKNDYMNGTVIRLDGGIRMPPK